MFPGRLPLLSLLAAFCLPLLESRASVVVYERVPSEALDRDVEVGLYLPTAHEEDEHRPLPCLVFLHGMFGDAHQWERRGVDRVLDALIDSGEVSPFFVVCPDGDNSMYVDWKSGRAHWERFFAEELPAWIRKRLPVAPGRRHLALSGDSMGGYGALHLAFRHPDVFGSVSAHSAALYPEDPERLPSWILARAEHWKDVFGSPIDAERWRRYNPLHLAATLPVEKLRSLAIYFDCGENDRFGFAPAHQRLHRILEERDVPHEFHLREGDHGRRYYLASCPYSFRFHDRIFAGGRATPRRDF